MHIKSISVSGLHNAIDAQINFDADLGIMVGINGSGKTSIINLTAHLLRLNVPELVQINFESIAIQVSDGTRTKIVIQAEKNLSALKITLKKGRTVLGTFETAYVDLAKLPIEGIERLSYERHIRRVSTELSTTPIAEFMRTHVKMTLVKLDRTLFAEDFTGAVAIDNASSPRSPRRISEIDPLAQVELAVRNKFAEYQSQVKKLNDQLTHKLVLQLFAQTDIFFQRKKKLTIPEVKDIRQLQRSLGKTSFYPKDSEGQRSIFRYFEITQKLAYEVKEKNSKGSDIWENRFYHSALERFDRLNTLATELNIFDQASKTAYEVLGNYLSAINSFLSESKKEAFFSEVDNTLRFRIVGETTATGRPMKDLSSGEKQIITVLAYLAFLTGENSIFVIDEPELSLHISWQTMLLNALQAVRPHGSQLLMATHSPEIVGSKREKVVRLIPQYRVSENIND